MKTENEQLREIIRRARAKFGEDGPDGQIASEMFSILGEADSFNPWQRALDSIVTGTVTGVDVYTNRVTLQLKVDGIEVAVGDTWLAIPRPERFQA